MLPKVYKTIQLVLLAGILIALVLLLKRPQPLTTQQQPASDLSANADSFQNKLGELQQAHSTGQSAEVHISSEEIVAALAAANPPTATTAQSGTSSQPPASPATDLNSQTSLNPDQVPVKDQQVVFDGDEVKGQFTTQVAGKDVVVTFGGHLGSKNGYVEFAPTNFQVGSMPIPLSLVQDALEKKLQSDPATRDRLKLPEFVKDVKVENGQLVLTEK
jgi:uncharacterized protein YpmS